MNGSRKKGFQQAGVSIDDGLNTLFATLSDALTTMLDRIEEGQTGAVQRDQVFETPKGPIRAHAGIRLRMGGMDAKSASEEPQPVNPDRGSSDPEKPKVKSIVYDVIDDEDEWVVTADLPGVSTDELQLGKNGTTLAISTTGTRSYAGQVDIGGQFSLSRVSSSMRNGILTLRVGKDRQT
ncbi:Hsp20/alpha crystallin family protein [Cognatiyoonia sp. IB215182]|uniref:Hsp20/alpha crystallin family protein n=1 Tax=Cognatiyoonia sp. IB215182 TaxID=3097353 RepID=UPI002A0E9A1C|nr:Hsp20/alpha crystallin family protein [Cognatiyoonia sp. IB215182]MDX8351424.1 Hsp20/alpha crystallin family protein [Cognatiyoonia sp. IB215182]